MFFIEISIPITRKISFREKHSLKTCYTCVKYNLQFRVLTNRDKHLFHCLPDREKILRLYIVLLNVRI